VLSWRQRARPIILRVIEENDDKPLREISAALRAAYPFGKIRQCREYKVWCSERAYRLKLRELRKKKEKPIEYNKAV